MAGDTDTPGKERKKRPPQKDGREKDGQAQDGQQPDFPPGPVIEIDEDLADTLDAIVNSETDDFFELCRIADINPKVDLAGADMHTVDLSGKDMSGADLTGTDLRCSKCIGTKLIGVKLRDAELQNADFRGADLTGADLTGADITGADFSGAKVSEKQLASAKGTPAARPPVNAGCMHKYRAQKNRRRHLKNRRPGPNCPS